MKMPNLQEIKNKVFKELKYLILYGYPGKILAAIISLVLIMPLPFDVYLVARWLLVPEGFWQNFFLFALWAVLLGWLQVIICVACVAFAIGILTDNL